LIDWPVWLAWAALVARTSPTVYAAIPAPRPTISTSNSNRRVESALFSFCKDSTDNFFSGKTPAAPNMGVVLGISLNGLACSGNLKKLRPRAGEKFSSNQGNKELNSFANNETRTQARSQSDGRANRPRQIRRLGEQARRQRLHGLRQAVRLDLL